MTAKTPTRPRFQPGTKVGAAGLVGFVGRADAGLVDEDHAFRPAVRLVEVRWTGEAEPVLVREDLLRRLTKPRKTKQPRQ